MEQMQIYEHEHFGKTGTLTKTEISGLSQRIFAMHWNTTDAV